MKIKLLMAMFAAFIAVPAAAAETITYTYDALGRLVKAQSAGTVNSNQTHSSCYDKAGNRIRYVSSSAGTPAACVTQG
ncbi:MULTISPECIES: hypothetical protein [Novosphingobium]|uniref:hypothetical protein n=1 Tax=Novosphingobium TaxID=165696 RepID=UPI0022F265B1|nr:hypothetical protein [Novosphingobium resinovorum]GLK45537.1 hypothetical protein GCM10017612_34570 [Novosphingobium resinovorum]